MWTSQPPCQALCQKTLHDLHDLNLLSLTSNLHACSVIKPPFWQCVCDSWELSAPCFHDLNKGAGWCVYPQDLEIDGMRDSERESVIVRDSAWVYTESISERAQPHLHSLQTDSGSTHKTKPTTMPQRNCSCSHSERGDTWPPLLMSKHDFIKQKTVW